MNYQSNGVNKPVAKIIDKISKTLKQNGKCNQFATELTKRLDKAKIKYEIIRVDSNSGIIYSDKVGMAISSNSYQYGIKIGNTIYDNMTEFGMSFYSGYKTLE